MSILKKIKSAISKLNDISVATDIAVAKHKLAKEAPYRQNDNYQQRLDIKLKQIDDMNKILDTLNPNSQEAAELYDEIMIASNDCEHLIEALKG